MKKLIFFITFISLLFHSCGTRKASETEISAIENSLSYSIQVKNDPQFFNLQERMAHYKVPGVSIAVVRDGRLHWTKGYGLANTRTGKEVTTNTLFQAASISKPLAALAVLKLAEEGKIDLDKDVNQYLKDYRIPQSKFTEIEKVTPRRLLTHTAGLNVSGFPGYPSKQTIPSTTGILRGEGNTDPVVNDTIPGSRWRYSGGGYTVLQKLVEDVSGMSFEVYMQEHILDPMGMKESSFEQPLPENKHAMASAAYDREGNLIDGDWNNYPEKAAAGLWTTPQDLARYELEIQRILKGENGILSKATVEKMLTKHESDWGLGPQLRKEGDSLLFQHGGKNAGFTNMFIASAKNDFGLVVMTNGDNARPLMSEIITGISEYYDWNVVELQEIEAASLSSEELQPLTGTYGRKELQKPEAEISIKNGRLYLKKLEDNTGYSLIPTDSLEFVEPGTERRFLFKKEDYDEASSFLLNGQIEFVRME
ncbi:serine hydrolase domain-containing protein [Salinimicrobium sp. HB62]|uniref:serine hydrolase domain-containing protein n=1 Tax=Salinimicrobium sp. HB62 TaxID=3077781 RepID=UPI002D789763|nr:serine hydrolase domain-containing protein [Salinimicrobium sp. HB62]